MPLHPTFAARLHLLDGISSFETALADPVLAPRLAQYLSVDDGTPPPAVVTATDHVPGPHGPVRVRLYTPPDDDNGAKPALVWLHGGGFRMGSIDEPVQDAFARQMCSRVGAVVVAVEYRLAVEGVCYPVPHDDVVASVRWVRQTADALGIDPALISVGGDSAGGNLAAGAALRLRDEDNWLPEALLLVYPTLHPVLPPLSPALAARLAELPDLLRFPPADIAEMNRNYLGGPESTADGYAMPALGVLEGLCRTVVVNAEYDDLRASGEAFVAALALAGVDVRQVTALGVAHSFLDLPNTVEPVSRILDLLAGELSPTVNH